MKHGPHGAKLTLLPLIAVIFFEVRLPLHAFLPAAATKSDECSHPVHCQKELERGSAWFTGALSISVTKPVYLRIALNAPCPPSVWPALAFFQVNGRQLPLAAVPMLLAPAGLWRALWGGRRSQERGPSLGSPGLHFLPPGELAVHELAAPVRPCIETSTRRNDPVMCKDRWVNSLSDSRAVVHVPPKLVLEAYTVRSSLSVSNSGTLGCGKEHGSSCRRRAVSWLSALRNLCHCCNG